MKEEVWIDVEKVHCMVLSDLCTLKKQFFILYMHVHCTHWFSFHHVVRGWNSALHIHPLSHFSGLVLCAFEVAPKHLKMNIPGKGHKPARVRVTLPTPIQANVSEEAMVP